MSVVGRGYDAILIGESNENLLLGEVCDADFHANYDLLKIFIVRAITPEGIPSFTDFKVRTLQPRDILNRSS